MFEIEVTDEYEKWFLLLTDAEQVDVLAIVGLLAEKGPTLPFPYSSGITAIKSKKLRELRIQHKGDPYRVLYAFDPRRAAILLLGGNKTGVKSWYKENVPKAERLFEEHLRVEG